MAKIENPSLTSLPRGFRDLPSPPVTTEPPLDENPQSPLYFSRGEGGESDGGVTRAVSNTNTNTMCQGIEDALRW